MLKTEATAQNERMVVLNPEKSQFPKVHLSPEAYFEQFDAEVNDREGSKMVGSYGELFGE